MRDTGAAVLEAEDPRAVPSVLKVAREARGLTQAEVATRAGLSQAAVSKGEAGLLEIHGETLSHWAEALRFHRTMLTKQVDDALPVTFFRKRASVKVSEARVAHARIAIRRMQVDALTQSVAIPEPEVPEVRLAEFSRGGSASAIARELRIAWRVPRGPIEDLTALLEDHGIIVVPCEFSTGVDGMSVFQRLRGSPPIMMVSKVAPTDRLRFTMAHELAHIVLHHHLPIPPPEAEDEANEFAAEFLMPSDDIKGHLKPNLDIEQLMALKARWRVSMSSLISRAHSLRRITPNRSRSLHIAMSQMGYRKSEPVQLAPESAESLDELLRVHREDLGFSEDELAQLTGLYVDEFHEVFGTGEGPAPRPRLRLVQ